MPDTLWKQLGAAFLVERYQKRRWNVSRAAQAAKIDRGVIERIERGETVKTDKLEKYAEALGKPLSAWLLDILAPDQPKETPRVSRASADSDGVRFRDRRRENVGPPTGTPERRRQI
jgi:transcriptional regulator with XRE-family HTH domain